MSKTRFREAMIRMLDSSGMSIAELSRRSGVSKEQLQKLVQRRTEATNVDDAVKIAAALGTTTEEMIGADDCDPQIARAINLLGSLDPAVREMLLIQIESLARR